MRPTRMATSSRNTVSYTHLDVYKRQEEGQTKTELMIYSKIADELTTLVSADWGQHALHPSWSADGSDIYYQFTKEEEVEDTTVTTAHLWSIAAGGGDPSVILEDSAVQLPAMRPKVGGGFTQEADDALSSPCLDAVGG